MGRPRGSFQNKQLALEFAETVTVASDSPASKVARAGSYSIFEVFAQCCPWAVRFHGGGALDGLTILEFNKLLESHDFLKVRRSAPPPGYTDNFADPSNPDYTGAYAFAKLRWRDPLDPEDCAELVEGRRSLQVLFCEGNRILDEENFLARILEAKLGTDRLECNLSQSATPRSGTPTWDRSWSSECSPEPRKRGRDQDVMMVVEEDDEVKRQRIEYASSVAVALQLHIMSAPRVDCKLGACPTLFEDSEEAATKLMGKEAQIASPDKASFLSVPGTPVQEFDLLSLNPIEFC
mmetsp:Transcript_56655/g.132696  ORF Transcript_56655/g.132696 Transcript_56655/m.132696 type:complete len:293 (+) Transcript_56655:96-974(+)